MKFRVAFTVLMLLLTVLLIIASCAKPVPSPSPKPAPTPAPAPTPTPKAQERFELKVWSFTVGTYLYLIAFAEAEMVNKYSSWLRAEAMESAGSVQHIKDIASKPEHRKNTIFNAPDSTVTAAIKGAAPFEKPYTGARAVIVASDTTMTWITYDKNIKTKDDFKGKRVMIQTTASSQGIGLGGLLKDAWKIWGDVKISYGDFNASARALRDGVVDIASTAINGISPEWEFTGAGMQLATEKPGFRPVGVSPADVAEVTKATSYLFHPVEIPVGIPKLKGMEYTAPFTTMGNMLAYWADESLNPEVVYEFVRIIYERIDEVKARFAGSFLTKNNMAKIPISEDMFHPGALKFYKEKGVPIGFKY